MKKTKILIISIFLITGSFIFYLFSTKQMYGNDKESIVKVINSIEGYENKSIEIVEVKDVNDLRIAGFLANNNPGYIQFQKNDDDNYLWNHLEVRENEVLHVFMPSPHLLMIVANQENKIAKMEVSVNGQLLEQQLTPYKTSVTWVDLPKTNDDQYTFQDYKFYDKDGHIIKE